MVFSLGVGEAASKCVNQGDDGLLLWRRAVTDTDPEWEGWGGIGWGKRSGREESWIESERAWKDF